MIAFITWNSILVPLIEGLCTSNPWNLSSGGLDRIKPMTYGLTVPRLGSDWLSRACTWDQNWKCPFGHVSWDISDILWNLSMIWKMFINNRKS